MLKIAHSGLEAIPNMNQLRTNSTIIAMLDFDSNKIKNITSSSINVKAENLILDHNNIEVIEDWSFHDSQIAKLSLKGNRNLRLITEDAFTGLKNLRSLDLSETSIRMLPTRGLSSLETLKITDTFAMRKFPSVLHFPEIKEAHLTYPYHCCAFKFPITHDPKEFTRLQSLRRDLHRRYCASTTTDYPTSHVTASMIEKRYVSRAAPEDEIEDNDENKIIYGELVYTASPDQNRSDWEMDFKKLLDCELTQGCFHPVVGNPAAQQFPLNDPQYFESEGIFHSVAVTIRPENTLRAICGNFAQDFRHVTCVPAPDAFNPCEDVMGQWSLRVAVWFVAIAAMLGNLAVLVVILSARSTMTVSKFLMCHLAFADFCMGLYLMIIASVDVHTMGTYFNHAIDWQHGAGCQVAGFLTVFSSELSIFTLTVITLERWYAITYAIHLNRRLHIGTAAKVMTLGWLYAIVMAALPIMGISGYTKTSICLPMENRNLTDLVYLICLLSVKGFAFFLICTCYAKMYLSIRVSNNGGNRQTPDLHANRAVRSDLSVAKRMAMLVFTDFACWAPIAFFGLTAVFGMPLIDVTKSKILLVFFYPLNSCANPFLYAILTKQYRRDVLALLARWGLCRHRSSCVHGRTLSTNTHHQQRRVSSVKALYRNSLVLKGNQRQQVMLSNSAMVRQFAVNNDRAMINDFYPNDVKSSAEYSGSISKESSPAIHRGSPHPIKNSFTKVHHPDQQIILRRVLEFRGSTNGSQSTSQVTTADHTTTDTTTDGHVSYDEDGLGNSRDTAV
ncbi:lutropin-choriogonadotropic hormone receptor-like isoform X2 [Stegodyphus dumicola]|uniref:lutropin-choriogonadotropic hormone receptor-like isoform X2 n=1 Tax=Stegodyphus dumicola TaxID=202533 RepID=UPI0015B01176|nr:lutropin-choriogonadotropic hormone receptor-like isoform X2 [Stegodyphus dumicola]